MPEETVVMDAPVADTAAVEAPAEVTTNDTSVENTFVEGAESQSVDAAKTNDTKVDDDGSKVDNKVDAKEGSDKTKADASVDATMPKQVSDLLKALADKNPENKQVKEITRQVRDAYFRNQAYSAAFPSASEAKQASEFVKTFGNGNITEGLKAVQEFRESVNQSDELLYSGDPKLVSNIVSDLEEQGALGALDKLSPEFMKAWSEANPKAYSAYHQRTISAALKTSGLHATLETIWKTDLNPQARKEVKNIAKWLEGLEASSGKFAADTKAKADEQTKAETAALKSTNVELAKTSEDASNKELGAILGKYRNSIPELKKLDRTQLSVVGVEIKKQAHEWMRDEKSGYQQAMNKLWGENGKNAIKNKAALIETHRKMIASVADVLVRKALAKTYPEINLNPAPKPTAPRVNPSAVSRAQVERPRSDFRLPAPTLVKERPANLIRDLDDGTLQILGRGWVPDPTNKNNVIFVSWKR